MRNPPYTEEQFRAALTRLGERDVGRLLQGGALDGDEARWAADWLTGDRTPAAAPAPAPEPAQEAPHSPFRLAS
jgi:hypothetical protein